MFLFQQLAHRYWVDSGYPPNIAGFKVLAICLRTQSPLQAKLVFRMARVQGMGRCHVELLLLASSQAVIPVSFRASLLDTRPHS